MPNREEFAELTPRPGSPVWNAASDVRLLAASGYATLLQVAQPTVGAGVHDYSSFVKDPWGRLLRTLDYVNGTIYGGPELAGEIGARVRSIHKTIKGRRADGERYNAMEPDAFAWVHATLADAVTRAQRHFIKPMSWEEKEAYWAEWRLVGRLVGVRMSDLPEGWAGFLRYFDRTLQDVLVETEAVHEVLALLDAPMPPFVKLDPRLWWLAHKPAGYNLRLATVGLMPPLLRSRLGLPWSSRDETAFRLMGAASRASGPLLPRRLKEFGPFYVKWRHKQLARGDVASRTPAAAA
jgi:uncharacterized protein (DUF2236 family)